MSRLTHALATLYALAAGSLCAYTCWANRRGDTAQVIVLASCAVLFGCAILQHAYHAYHRDQLRFALKREREARPPGRHAAAIADEITLGWHALNDACCLRQWETAGAEHDPDHCTRKDTSA